LLRKKLLAVRLPVFVDSTMTSTTVAALPGRVVAPFFKVGKEMLRRLNGDGMKLSHAATTAPDEA
jgi:hypothetical protein